MFDDSLHVSGESQDSESQSEFQGEVTCLANLALGDLASLQTQTSPHPFNPPAPQSIRRPGKYNRTTAEKSRQSFDVTQLYLKESVDSILP